MNPKENNDKRNGEAACLPCDNGCILVVDDEEKIRWVFGLMLKTLLPDYKVDMVVNGLEAVDKFQSGHHGVILMDLKMPIMDGHTAFLEIKKMCAIKNWEMPSVIFCTGYDLPDGVQEIVTENPIHCLLLKPISSETLYRVIKSRC